MKRIEFAENSRILNIGAIIVAVTILFSCGRFAARENAETAERAEASKAADAVRVAEEQAAKDEYNRIMAEAGAWDDLGQPKPKGFIFIILNQDDE